MPTPGGKLKAGDRLRFRNKDGSYDGPFKVAERLGNDLVYSVVVEYEDRRAFPAHLARYGNRWQMLLLEAHYHVFMAQGGWELIPSELIP